MHTFGMAGAGGIAPSEEFRRTAGEEKEEMEGQL